jgi:SAM-dependent methyltransferase
MPEAASRFSAVAAQYDAVRPTPPADLIAVIAQWAGVASPDVVDLGAGTGLSSVAWAGRARQVTAVEPSAGMRRLAGRRIAHVGAGYGRDHGDAERLVGLAVSAISHVADFLAEGAAEDELGITALRVVATRRLAEPLTWWWTYRVRLAVM